MLFDLKFIQMVQHETLPLKEEKQFIREIKQLKQLCEQLSSNMGSQDQIQQALNQREEVQDRLKKHTINRPRHRASLPVAIENYIFFVYRELRKMGYMKTDPKMSEICVLMKIATVSRN
ncbi:CAP-Gly domain-containing linker protein 1 [Abeliophyllum distichum]|uniref:CAP-Gly domain-containing linker protein 1 n=1 Tax=Abeliophyllum distichum TaxID=126358 RepID=A0ABD1QXB6_9LAMI